MSNTPFDPTNKDFTDKCHNLAQKTIYPELFNVPREYLSFTDTDLGTSRRNTILDGEMATDRIVSIQKPNMQAPMDHMIQERFRRPEFATYRDLTITEWNTLSNLPSELYKLKSGIFVYGYGNNDTDPDDFIEVIAIDTAKLLRQITSETIKYKRSHNHRTEQYFITITFDDLKTKDDILYSYYPKREVYLQPSIIHWPGWGESYHPTFPREILEQWVKSNNGTKAQIERYKKDIDWYNENT